MDSEKIASIVNIPNIINIMADDWNTSEFRFSLKSHIVRFYIIHERSSVRL